MPIPTPSAAIPELMQDLQEEEVGKSPMNSAENVSVKPLRWNDGARVHHQGQGILGWLAYVTTKDQDGYEGSFWYNRKAYETLDEAKAAAQADYEQRILSCLRSPPTEDADRVELDGNEIWEWLFGHLEGDVPPVLDDGLLNELAQHINTHFLSRAAPQEDDPLRERLARITEHRATLSPGEYPEEQPKPISPEEGE